MSISTSYLDHVKFKAPIHGNSAEVGRITSSQDTQPPTQAARLMGERDKINLKRVDTWTTGDMLSEPLTEMHQKFQMWRQQKNLETHDIMGQCNYEMFAVCIPNSQDVAIGHPKKNSFFHNQGKTGKQILRKGVVSKFEPPKPHGWQYPKAPRPWSMDPSNWTEICKQQLPFTIFLVIEKQPNSKITN